MRLIALFLLLVWLSACTGMTPQQLEAQTRTYVYDYQRPDFVLEALLRKMPAKGMNARDIEYLYGSPVRVNTASYGEQHVHRQLCQYSRKMFQENIYVYYEQGLVTAWQINDCIY